MIGTLEMIILAMIKAYLLCFSLEIETIFFFGAHKTFSNLPCNQVCSHVCKFWPLISKWEDVGLIPGRGCKGFRCRVSFCLSDFTSCLHSPGLMAYFQTSRLFYVRDKSNSILFMHPNLRLIHTMMVGGKRQGF